MRDRTKTKLMVLLVLAACVGVLVALAFGCRTDPETGEAVADWNAIAVEVGLAAGDLRGASTLAGDPDTREQLEALAEHMDSVHAALEAWLESGAASGSEAEQLVAVIELAVGAAEQLVDDDERVWVEFAKSILRRVKVYIPRNQPGLEEGH